MSEFLASPTNKHFHGDYSSRSYVTHAFAKLTLKPLLNSFPLLAPTLRLINAVDDVAGLSRKNKLLDHQEVKVGPWGGHWFRPKGCESREVILYFHGGAYITCGVGTHRRIIEELAIQNNRPVFAVEYRMFPQVFLDSMVSDCMDAVDYLLKQGYRPEQITVAGDSAGGGLSMRVAGDCLTRGQKLKAVVLLSAWLDFSTTQEEYARWARRDAYIPAQRLPKIAKLVLGRDPLPEDSPISRLKAGFPPVLFIVGATEVLRVDAEKAYDRCEELGVETEFHYFSGGVHAFPVIWNVFPEGRRAMAVIKEFIGDEEFEVGLVA